MDKPSKRDAQVVESESELDESPQPADDQRSTGRPTEDDKRGNENRSMEGVEMGLQNGISVEDSFVRSLKYYWL